MIDIQVSKKKLPKGTSYPIKTSIILEALEKEGFKLDVHLSYWASVGGHLSFEAGFYPPGGAYPNEHIHLHINNVPAADAKLASANIEEDILPAFLQWLKDILSHPPDSTIRREKQKFHMFGNYQ